MIDHLRQKGLGVDPVCRVLQLSPSTYFARKKRPKSARRLRDERLMPLIEEAHATSGGTYGARRITRALRRKGHEVARCTVERLIAELGLEGVIRGRRRRTTVPEPSAPRPPDLVDRDFTASRPDQLWVADMTYVRTWSGWAYVAFVLDVYSRMIVGWQVANHMRTELPLDALEMALWRRRIKKDSGLIHYSDRGSQYVSIRYTDWQAVRQVADRKGHDLRYAIRDDKARGECGYRPLVDFGAGLARTVEWYRRHRSWWGR
ncbi:IS3 family transposase [Streptomyces caniscabiei]|uniref:IS3 family transposase n=2 Tax=Streptomyces caniscabiei TaxID=2746961 RepID=UPI0029B30E9C|nr:IS3 family transposase [Streptomyces caniscabiei]MDX2741432.1 IS3 family transposase [Streptomyces caniscabiei]MDX2781352.1 IS3 family transposase [Streptomyces caniscabiei]